MTDTNTMHDTTIELNTHFEQWQRLSPIGLSLVGFGLSITGEAIALKSKRQGFWRWFIVGTIGLSVVNAGIAIFGEAVKHRTLYETLYRELRQR